MPVITERVDPVRCVLFHNVIPWRLSSFVSDGGGPTYGFECFACGHEFELPVPYSPKAICPECGSWKVHTVGERARVRR